MSMKKIMYAGLTPTGSTDANGSNCEWAWAESTEAEYGAEWEGNVAGYVENLDLPEGVEINGEYSGSIHNLPEGAVILTQDGEPVEIYWAKGASIAQLRKERGMTQQKLADAAELNIRQVQKLESGETPMGSTSLRIAVRVADALGIQDLRELL